MRLSLDRRGMAMGMAITLLLFLLPLMLVFIKRTQISTHLSARERMTKTSRALAVNAMVDYMRQFSQSHEADHMDPSILTRTESFYEAGFTNVTYSTDTARRLVFLSARGKYGQNTGAPLETKRLNSVIKFISDITRFGTILQSNFTAGVDNVVYRGGVWSRGNFRVEGSNVRVEGNLVVDGNLTRGGAGNMQVQGDLFVGGTISNAAAANITVTGNQYNYAPSMDLPPVDVNYYSTRYTTRTPVGVGFEDWTFLPNGTLEVRNAVGGPVARTINLGANPRGAIIFAPDTRLFIRGRVRGRVTVVCTGTPESNSTNMNMIGITTPGNAVIATGGAAVKGTVKVENPLTYADSMGNTVLNASAENSLAILATNFIILEKTGPSAAVANFVGIYHVAQGTLGQRIVENLAPGATAATGGLTITGVRTSGIQDRGAFPGVFLMDYDVNLTRFPPPGLPEKPVMVSLDFN